MQVRIFSKSANVNRASIAIAILMLAACGSGGRALSRSQGTAERPGISPLAATGMFLDDNNDTHILTITLALKSQSERTLVMLGPLWRGDPGLQSITAGIVPDQLADAAIRRPYSGPALTRSALLPDRSVLVFLRLRSTCRPAAHPMRPDIAVSIVLNGHSTLWSVPSALLDSPTVLTSLSPAKLCGR